MLRRGNKKRDGHGESSSNANNDDGAARASVYPSSGSNGSNLNLSSAALAGGSGGPSRPLTIRTTSQSTSQSIEASTRAMQHQHSHHPHSGPFTSRHIPSSSSVDALSPFGSSPGSTAPIYYHPPQQQQQQQQQQQPPQQVQQMQTQQQSSSSSMGRSQSAFNFILAKAKAPFSSSSSQQQIAMHPSPSMSSMVNSQGIPEDGGNFDAGRSRYTSNPSTQPSAPAMERRGTNEQQAAPSWASMRPSMGDDQAMPISSPTKRSFFGAHRERKASTTSLTRSMAASPASLAGAGAGAGATPSQPSSSPSMPMSMSVYDRDRDRDRERSRGALSPLSKASSSYGQFSKSQSDLHMRSSDFPSPGHSVVDLPKVPSLRGAMQAVHQDDASLLRSPSPQYGFSRSVDDLAQSAHSSSAAATTSGKAAAMSPPLRPAHQSTMGEHGVAAHDWGRPSDVGTLASSRQQQQVPFSSASTPKQQSASSSSPSQQQQQHHHQRKASKQIKDDREAYLQQTSRGQLPGITYEGLLNRNANISLPLAQLVADGAGGAKCREKDITKGWKPYKVQLREGKLYFYKPPSAFSDDMKHLFPVHVVRGGGPNAAAAYAREIGLDPEAIKRGKLGTQDLLAATSGKQNTSSALAATSTPAWAFPAKHPDLVLVDAVEKPATWAARVQGGSHDALAHEYVFATQSDPDEEGDRWKEEAGMMLYALLTALSRSARPMHGFLVAIQKWTLMALSDKDEGTAASEPVQKRERIRARIQLLVESDLVEFGQLHERASLESVLEGIVGDAWRDERRMAADVLATLKESQPAEPPHDWLSRRERPTRSELTALVNAGLGPSTLLRTDPAEVARQIHAFHIDHLASLQLPSASTVRLLAKSPSTTRSHRLLCFDSSAPHLLTSLVLDQVLFSSGSASPADSRSEQQAGSRQRATLLRHWIAVASCLLKMHDVAGWAAICAALCSRAVTRLSMTWRFVAKEDRAIVGDYWARQLADLGWSELAISPDGTKREPVEAFISSPATIKYAMAATSASAGPEAPTVPFLGNSIVQARAYPPLASSASFLPLVETREVGARLWTLNKAWQLGAHNRMNPSVLQQQHGIAPSPDIQRALQSLLELHQSVTDSDMAFRNLSRSLAIEPRIDVPKRNKRPLQLSKKTATLALSPLLFVDSLPNLSLVDRQEMAVYAEEANGNGGAKKADEQGTITEKNAKTRSPLMSLPPALMRRASKAFSPGMLSRPLKGVSFAGITEFNSGEGGSEESLIRMGSDIVFAITSEPSVSLPSSPMTSKRFSTELNRAARPISQVSSKRSSLPASNRSSMVEPPTPVQVHVVVKAASLDRLVDILVMGVQHLSVNTSEDSAERPSGRKSRLVMDLPLFRTSFLSTFRLFCSPVLLLDLLRKRFVAAINASREMALPEQHRSGNPFPTWSLVETVGTHVEPIDWDTVSRIRSGITSVLTAWIARFPHDFAEDHELYIGVHSLTQDMDTLLPRHPEDSEYEKMASTLESLVRQLRASVMGACARQGDRVTASRRTSQPVLSGVTPPASTLSPSQKQLGTSSSTATTIDFDTITPAELVDYLESVASIFVDKIEERDLLAISELFENQASDALGWYVDSQHSQQQQQPSSQDDSQPLCTNMYKLIELLRYGGAGSGSSLHMCLPMAVRDACAAQNLLRGWVAINIIEMRIGLARRQARLEKLLDAVWICRARMANTRVEEQSSTPLSPSFPFKEATIASFVESAIVGSLGSPESRYHLRAWQGVAAARNAAGDKLADLFPPQSTWNSIKDSATTTTGALCALDIGWLLECLAQASTRSSEAAPHPLVDFEKYRTIYTLIDASLHFKSQMSAVATVAPEVANARLTEMQRALRSVAWDRRAFKEEASQEAATASPLPANAKARAMYRPLTGLLGQQQDKQQRDRRAYEVLVKQLQQQQQQQGQQQQQQQQFQTAATSPSLQAPSSSSPSSSASSSSGLRVPGMDASSMGNKGGEKKTRRMTALFRGAVRPMGGLMSFDRPSPSVGDSTDAGASASRAGVAPMEMLQLTPTQKPALIIPCGAARVSVWQNSQRSYCFHLSSIQNGQHVLLQAPSQADVSEWFSQIERAAKEYAGEMLSKPMDKRSAEKAEKAAAAAAAAAAASASGKGRPTVPLYGTDIKVLVEHERREVPLGLVRMLQEVEARGLQEQGIYRISGAKSAIEHLKVAFGQQPAESIDLTRGEFSDVHTIAGAIKQWFRDLPEPPIPFKYYNAIIEAEKMESEEDRLYAIRDMIWEFPKPHFDLLRRISEHLARVVEEGKSNLMAPHNIGLVFGTSLLNPPPGPASVAQSFGNIGSAAHIVKIIVTMHEWLFEPEPEPEPEPEAEPEVEPEGEAGQGQEPESQGISVDEAEIGGRDDDDADVGADADANLVQTAEPGSEQQEAQDQEQEQGQEQAHDVAVRGGAPAPREDAQQDAAEGADGSDAQREGGSIALPLSSRSGAETLSLLTPAGTTTTSAATNDAGSSSSSPGKPTTSESDISQYHNLSSGEAPSEVDSLVTTPGAGAGVLEGKKLEKGGKEEEDPETIRPAVPRLGGAQNRLHPSSSSGAGAAGLSARPKEESIYLDAQDAIAVLNPFEDE